MEKVIVTGGAGYIGSHAVRSLAKAGYRVLILDNLSSGHREAVKGYELVECDLAEKGKVSEIFRSFCPDAVMHFAGSIEAGESMTDPKRFYNNNVANGLILLDAMLENSVRKIVFSSSAAVYGEPERIPISEEDVKNPTNVYGLTKLIFEQMLNSYNQAYGISSVSLRYFNAAGADPSGEIGADHKNKTHLITLAMLTALGKRDSIKIFGTDYDTQDGTCIRDYIHVTDLADAHVLALQHIHNKNIYTHFNLGSEQGNSVREVLNVTKRITGVNFRVDEVSRRDGDPAKLIASSQKAKTVLNWNPKFKDIDTILETAWHWHRGHPDGFTKKR